MRVAFAASAAVCRARRQSPSRSQSTRGARSGWRGPSRRSARGGWSGRRAASRPAPAARSDSRRSRRRRPARNSPSMRHALAMPRPSTVTVFATEIGSRPRNVALGMTWMRARGKCPLYCVGALVGRELDGDAARASAAASASAGKQMAAGAAGGERERRRLRHQAGSPRACRRRDARAFRRAAARASARAACPCRGEREHRRAAIGDERQRHALGRNEMQVDRHVDRRLQAEQDREARRPQSGRTDLRCAAQRAARASR